MLERFSKVVTLGKNHTIIDNNGISLVFDKLCQNVCTFNSNYSSVLLHVKEEVKMTEKIHKRPLGPTTLTLNIISRCPQPIVLALNIVPPSGTAVKIMG